MRAALYVRLSRDRDGLSTGPDRQLADCRAMAAARVWDVVGEFVFRDVSAYNRHTPRPAYEAMITGLEAGAVDVIVAWKLDRLLRRPRDFEELWDPLEAHGASLATVADGIDSTQPIVGELVPRLLTTFAKLESQNLSLRVKRKHEEIAAAGRRAGGGRRPFGLTADGTEILNHEAQAIRAAAEAITMGTASRNSVALDWNARGIRTSTGRLWTQQLVANMLRSPRPLPGSGPRISSLPPVFTLRGISVMRGDHAQRRHDGSCRVAARSQTPDKSGRDGRGSDQRPRQRLILDQRPAATE